MIPVTTRKSKWSFRSLSIRQRLPLLICFLLVCTVIAFGWLSQLGVRSAAVDIGKDRLGSITQNLTLIYGGSAEALKRATIAAAAQPAYRAYLVSATDRDSALTQLDKLRADSSWVLVELLNGEATPVLQSRNVNSTAILNSSRAVAELGLPHDSCQVGKLYVVDGLIYFAVIAPVTEHAHPIGFLVRWRVQTATAKDLAQFSQLLGTDATLYMGNADGSVWTNMIHEVPAPPVKVPAAQPYLEYRRPNIGLVVASAQAVPNTPWTILIEFPESVVLESFRRFLPWMISIGAVLVVLGILMAWLMSRSITEPLEKLTVAAAAIAQGDYSVSVATERQDELGRLATIFNIMASQVKNAQAILERQVDERTEQLHSANTELEAFSYSVSHDLRAPLRHISAYATMLQEDYGEQLNGEGTRLTNNIILRTQNMSHLIDSLISFSQVSRQELRKQRVDMNGLAHICVTELLSAEQKAKYKVIIEPMPDCFGDPGLLGQVWVNLIANAIKYSSKIAVPVLRLGYSRRGIEPAYFISDNGAGFDMQYAGKLFGVFQRLHDDREFDGTGIGLSLVKRIINRHNGDIRAEAKVGEGASFYFTVPLANDYAHT